MELKDWMVVAQLTILAWVIYRIGYFKGRADGLDYANKKMGGIVDTLRKINEIMGETK